MKERAGHSIRVYGLLLLAAAAIVPSCGGSGSSNNGSSTSGTSSMNGSVSGDGRFVAFDSNDATLNLSGPPPGSTSTGGVRQIFLFDRSAGTSKLLTPGQGAAANGESSNPVISQNGNWVAFESTASNLIGTTTGSTTASTTSGATTTSTTTAGTTAGTTASTTAGTTMSTTAATTTGATTTTGTTSTTTGSSGANGHRQIFVTNVSTGQTRLVSGSTGGGFGDGDSMNPSISANGQMIAFESTSVNMVSGSTSTTSSLKSVFVWNMSSNLVQLVSSTAAGSGASADSTNASISTDGRFVAFQSAAADLVSGGTTSGSTTGPMRIFVRSILGNTTIVVTPDQSNVVMNGNSSNPSINSDGTAVAFESTASNLISGSSNSTSSGLPNIFVWSRLTGQSTLVSVGTPMGTGSTSAAANGDSHHPALSADSRFVAFDSTATNLTTTAPTNNGSNVFLFDRLTSTTTLVNQPQTATTTSGTTTSTSSSTTTSTGTTPTASSASSGSSTNPSVSQDGAWVAFSSTQTGLTSDTSTSTSNVFLANRTTGDVLLVSKEAATTSTTTSGTTSTTTAGTTASSTSGTTASTTAATTTGATTTAGTTTAATTTGATTTAGTTTATTTTGATTGATTFGETGSTTVGTTVGTTGMPF